MHVHLSTIPFYVKLRHKWKSMFEFGKEKITSRICPHIDERKKISM